MKRNPEAVQRKLRIKPHTGFTPSRQTIPAGEMTPSSVKSFGVTGTSSEMI